DIYPARELPIEGVTSALIYDQLRPDMVKQMARLEDLPRLVAARDNDVLVVLGAGDVDNYCDQLAQILNQQ
ncbi:MAG: UDP-N-acetylmuramate--L-alanine ligase, partial [Bacteroidaceae bacterium]|nr:UDP-N-acetylmuramate--L-alanine ligase [Bacteroidaceae bacterium]